MALSLATGAGTEAVLGASAFFGAVIADFGCLGAKTGFSAALTGFLFTFFAAGFAVVGLSVFALVALGFSAVHFL